MKTLFAGPFVGEFGWELFSWQGYLRTIAPQYEKVIISSRPYNEFIPYDPGNFMCNYFVCNTVGRVSGKFDKQYPDAVKMYPDTIGQIKKYFKNVEQTFIPYESNEEVDVVNFVFHARMLNGYGGYKELRNWKKEKWNELAANLINNGYKIASIGTSDSSIHVDGTLNYLDKDLKTTCSLLNKSKMIVGQSSGPMHFASLCRCPQYVWTGKENIKRYEKEWNPFGVPVKLQIEDKWDPEVEIVANGILKFLEELDK